MKTSTKYIYINNEEGQADWLFDFEGAKIKEKSSTINKDYVDSVCIISMKRQKRTKPRPIIPHYNADYFTPQSLNTTYSYDCTANFMRCSIKTRKLTSSVKIACPAAISV